MKSNSSTHMVTRLDWVHLLMILSLFLNPFCLGIISKVRFWKLWDLTKLLLLSVCLILMYCTLLSKWKVIPLITKMGVSIFWDSKSHLDKYWALSASNLLYNITIFMLKKHFYMKNAHLHGHRARLRALFIRFAVVFSFCTI